jgi:hypothetical protein
MPKAAVQLGAAAQVLPLDRIADAVMASMTSAGHGRTTRDGSGGRPPRMPLGASHG